MNWFFRKTRPEKLVNYDQLNTSTLKFNPQPFTEFEDELFNGRLLIENLFIDRLNDDELISVMKYHLVHKIKDKLVVYCTSTLLNHEKPEGYFYMGHYMEHKHRDIDMAVKFYDMAGVKGLDYASYHASRLYIQKKKYDKAKNMLDKAIELNNTAVHYYELYVELMDCITMPIIEQLKLLYMGVITGSKLCLDKLEYMLNEFARIHYRPKIKKVSFEENSLDKFYNVLSFIETPNQLVQNKLATLHLTKPTKPISFIYNGKIYDHTFNYVGEYDDSK